MLLGKLLETIREDKGITKTELSKLTKINIGHLTHIEKGDRTPSHKALKNICYALHVPYQQLMYTYDKKLSPPHQSYNISKHIGYEHIPVVNSIEGFVACPQNASTASLAFKMPDDSMEPHVLKDSLLFIEFNVPLNNQDIGVFQLHGKILIRRFLIKSDSTLVLHPDNGLYPDISISCHDNFVIIGKVLDTVFD